MTINFGNRDNGSEQKRVSGVAARGGQLSQMAVLVVSASPDTVDQLREGLHELGFSVISAEGFRTAVAALHARSVIGTVLCDFELPDGHALQLIDYIKTNLRFRHMPLIITATRIDAATARQCIACGASGLILLPVEADELLRRLKDSIERSRRTILIAMDDPVPRTILWRMLQRDGYVVLAAQTGREVVKFLGVKRIDAVISGLLLPDMSGLDLLVEVKGSHPHTVFALVTDSSAGIDHKKLLAAGVDGIISRPFENTAVRRKVKQWFDKYS